MWEKIFEAHEELKLKLGEDEGLKKVINDSYELTVEILKRMEGKPEGIALFTTISLFDCIYQTLKYDSEYRKIFLKFLTDIINQKD